ncbi:MAG: SMP-30/gluconolactonase/LRE family protein, partial [Alphaproteobacteria bacterium]|nr:SMP-30/gluconolactonase/LRE family protein [Alphaproteobacteria bacterium]
QEYIMPEAIGWVHQRADHALIVGLQSGVYLFDPNKSKLDLALDLEPNMTGNRLNDAKINVDGSLWAGTMDNAETNPTGKLYRITSDMKAAAIEDGYIVSNGPAFSPDGTILYHTSSATREIFAFDLTDNGAKAINKRCHIRFSEDMGYPDGMTCDQSGGLWVAHWDGWRISRFFEDGSLDFSIPMPVQRPTSICFGGIDLDDLYITSASINLDKLALEQQPLAGSVFHMKSNFKGMKQNLFGG